MIISSISGGLGNQMFQYAFGRALSLAKDTVFTIWADDHCDYSLHNGFELDRMFNLSGNKANESDFQRVLGWRSGGRIRQALVRRRFAWLRGSRIVVEPLDHYGNHVPDFPEDCYVVGYWQSEKYFKDFQDVIREDFIFRTRMSIQNRAVKEKMASCDAISLHVRRGDYISNQKTFDKHGICSMGYYVNAVEFIANRCEMPELFIFSDDMAWVKENLKFEIPCHFIDHNCASESFNDMRLMSFCQHHIIANSSFSWWGAWLNASAEKLVVAPDRWFNSNQLDTRDLIPNDWIKL